MTTRKRYALAGAGLVALGAACASTQRTVQNPTSEQAQLNQRQSEQALDRARDAQKRASDQEKRATQAQAEVERLQQELTAAQQREQEEAAKAEQLQREAAIATRVAAQQAARSQQQAVQALGQQQQQADRGEQVVSGLVSNLSRDQIAVQPRGESQPMTFQVTGQTRVEMNGQAASLQDIQPGQDARVAYQLSGTTPTATTIQIVTAPGFGTGPGSTPQGGGEGSSGQGNGRGPEGQGSTEQGGVPR